MPAGERIRTNVTVVTVTRQNEHIDLQRLSELLRPQLNGLRELHGLNGAIEPLGTQKTGVDSTTKGVFRDRRGRPAAVVICSRPVAPDLVARGVRNSEQIRTMLGRQLGSVILKPLMTGCVEGLSYAILPWRRPLASSRSGWLMQRLRLRPQVLRWLHRAVGRAREVHAAGGTPADFATPLRHLRTLSFLDRDVQEAADVALGRLESGAWRPVHTFDHNDMGRGNFLIAGADERAAGGYGFVLIDWVGATPRGFGLYDLLRFAHSFRLGPKRLARELLRPCGAMECDPVDLRGQLLACLGRLHMHLEYFPESNYLRVFGDCWRTLSTVAVLIESTHPICHFRAGVRQQHLH